MRNSAKKLPACCFTKKAIKKLENSLALSLQHWNRGKEAFLFLLNFDIIFKLTIATPFSKLFLSEWSQYQVILISNIYLLKSELPFELNWCRLLLSRSNRLNIAGFPMYFHGSLIICNLN